MKNSLLKKIGYKITALYVRIVYNLNDCVILDTVTDFFYYSPRRIIKDIKFYIKNKFCLLTHGWQLSDGWDMAVWFCRTAPKILQRMADNTDGVPPRDVVNIGRLGLPELFPEGALDADAPEFTPENRESVEYIDWVKVLRGLADLIQNSNSNTCKYVNDIKVVGEVWKTTPANRISEDGKILHLSSIDFVKNPSFDAWCARETEIELQCVANQKRSIKLFAELFQHLWY